MTRRAKRIALLLFFAAFLIYNLNLRPISSGDTAPAALLPFALRLDHAVYFDRFVPWFQKHYEGHAYFFTSAHGHYYSTYPIGAPLLVLPLYAPLWLIDGMDRWSVEDIVLLARVLEKLAASLVAAAGVGIFFLLADRILPLRLAVVASLAFGFATGQWSTGSQALWQHGASALLVTACLLFLEPVLAARRTRRSAALAGLCAGLSAAMRPTDVLLAVLAVAVLLVIRAQWSVIVMFLLGSAVPAGATAAYNLSVFGDIRGGYRMNLGANVAAGLEGLLFSPGRGLFVYTPLLLLLIPAAFCWNGRKPLLLLCALLCSAHILLYSEWPTWWAGHCFGPRFMTDIDPCLILLLTPLLPHLGANRVLAASFTLLLLLSIAIQFLGAFSYPKGLWDATPVSVDRDPGRLWNWHDTPFSRGLSAGINVQGYFFVSEAIDALRHHRKIDTRSLKIARSQLHPVLSARIAPR